MSSDLDDHKKLLAAADEEITQLREEVARASQAFTDMTEAQMAQDMQFIELMEQVETLEAALTDAGAVNLEAQKVIEALKNGMGRLRHQINETFEAVQENAPRVEMQARIWEIATAAQMTDEDRLTEQYNKQMAALREKTKPV